MRRVRSPSWAPGECLERFTFWFKSEFRHRVKDPPKWRNTLTLGRDRFLATRRLNIGASANGKPRASKTLNAGSIPAAPAMKLLSQNQIKKVNRIVHLMIQRKDILKRDRKAQAYRLANWSDYELNKFCRLNLDTDCTRW